MDKPWLSTLIDDERHSFLRCSHAAHFTDRCSELGGLFDPHLDRSSDLR